MIPAADWLLFISASIALSLAPGPDNIFVLMQSALHGRRAGVLVTLGLCTGLLFHTAAVVLGVAALVQTSALAFTLLKLIGAAYLLYLAWGAFRATPAGLAGGSAPALSDAALYRRGIIMNLSNPKVAIFFLAFLPQFADPARGPVSVQVMICGLVFIVCALVVFCGIAWGSGFLGDCLRRSPRAAVLLNRVAGIVFVGLALRLVMTPR